ncbi:MAG TPA: Fic/DOC family N-terminal domain-containing protein [Mycobacteriales bacterium]|nr:Fic/DOC family N-terminal domain-containing protein [Mycobacteriales bacterium]
MDLEALGNSSAGQLVPIQGHDEYLREYSYFAYLPNPLPTSVELTNETWNAVSEATGALSRLGEACRGLPNPGLLIAPALAREAVDTSALEGTYGALADVLEARLPQARPASPEVVEIRAYEEMAHQAFQWIREGRPLTVPLLEDLQGILARDSRTPPRDPGKVREHQVLIGPRGCTVYDARYIPPPPDDRLRAGLEQWQQWLYLDLPLPAPLRCAMAHYQFEALHPFGDGNGRIGRLVVVLQLLVHGVLTEPAITISTWLLKRRDEYQDNLLAVSQSGDWNPWVTFFCRALCEQSAGLVTAAGALKAWLEEVRAQLNQRHWSGKIAVVAADLIDWPVVTMPFVRDHYGVSAPTAKGIVDRLVEIGVLTELTGKSYGRIYGAKNVIAAVEFM